MPPLSIDPESAVAPFEQLRRQILAAVQSGGLVPGAKLPTVRALAAELGLAANTVARAYRELEHDEIIETRGRHGSFVATGGDATRRRAQEAALAYADRVLALGLSPEEGAEIAKAALAARSGA